MRRAVMGRVTHREDYTSELTVKIVDLIGSSYNISFADPKKERHGRTLRNLFFGEMRMVYRANGVEVEHSLNQDHNNCVTVTAVPGSQLYEDIGQKKIITIDGLLKMISTRTESL
jgi:hypothetical protein